MVKTRVLPWEQKWIDVKNLEPVMATVIEKPATEVAPNGMEYICWMVDGQVRWFLVPALVPCKLPGTDHVCSVPSLLMPYAGGKITAINGRDHTVTVTYEP